MVAEDDDVMMFTLLHGVQKEDSTLFLFSFWTDMPRSLVMRISLLLLMCSVRLCPSSAKEAEALTEARRGTERITHKDRDRDRDKDRLGGWVRPPHRPHSSTFLSVLEKTDGLPTFHNATTYNHIMRT